jgi:hypothetical protein
MKLVVAMLEGIFGVEVIFEVVLYLIDVKCREN